MAIADQLVDINNSKQAIKQAIDIRGGTGTVGTGTFTSYAGKIIGIPVNPWIRNPAWTALPTVSTSTQGGFVGLFKVEEDSNFLAITVGSSSGTHTIDWGDGTTSTSALTSYTAYKQYDYATLSNDSRGAVTFNATTDTVSRTNHGYQNGMPVSFAEITTTTGITVDHNYYVINATSSTFQISSSIGGTAVNFTNDGSGYLLKYKQVIVNYSNSIPANTTSINFNVRHNQSGLNAYNTGWMDLIVSATGLTSLTLGASSPSVFQGNLEQFQLISTNTISSFSFFFGRCYNLRSIPKFVLRTSGTTTMANMFNFCYSLEYAPWFTNIAGAPAADRVTSVDTMFRYCYSLKYVPNYDLSNCTNFNTMLGDATALEYAPMLTVGNASNTMINMFFGSTSLKTVPLYNTTGTTSVASMFSGCTLLQEIPAFNLNGITASGGLTTWLSGCTSLAKIKATGARFTHSIASCKMSASALDAYYTALPTITGQTLTVTGNWGVATDNPAIATAKGWTVTG